MKLDILICSLHSRIDFLKSMIGQLGEQDKITPETIVDGDTQISRYSGEKVNIYIITDHGKMSVGTKRNELLKLASSDYLTFIDDDDRISPDYLGEILGAMAGTPDLITYRLWMYEDNRFIYDVTYDKDVRKDSQVGAKAYRIPNHLMVWRTHMVKNVKFPDISYGEDGEWAKKAVRKITTQTAINKVLYFYMFSAGRMVNRGKRKSH